jgi:hypothetical protein
MATCAGKIRSSDEESGVEVRRESANRLGFRQIGVFLDLSDKNIATWMTKNIDVNHVIRVS